MITGTARTDRPLAARQGEDVPGQTEGTDPAPRISVVIPTHGRPDQLVACLEGLARTTVPPGGFEVIVVDDGGPAPAAPALERFAGQLELRVIRQARNGPGAARNAGAAAARGQLLAFIDDDCVPSTGWLDALARQFGATPDALLGGPVTNALPHNPFATASQLIASYTYRYYDRVPGAERFFTTNNFALPASRFRGLGGFDHTIPSATAEDKEFCDRWRHHGGRFQPVADAVVHHAHRLTFFGFLRQHHNYGRGIFCFRATRPRDGVRRLRPEPYGFYLGLLLYPLREAGHGKWRQTALVLVSQLATISGAIRAALVDVHRLRARGRGHAIEP